MRCMVCVCVCVRAEAHLNTCFKHFICFVNEFKLIEEAELQPLADVINSMLGKKVHITSLIAGR